MGKKINSYSNGFNSERKLSTNKIVSLKAGSLSVFAIEWHV
jgi:hypothetical protein